MLPKISLAPLQGLTNMTYRKLFPQYFPGIDRVYTPYFSINAHTMPRKKKIRESLEAGSPHFEVVPQVLTDSADAFVAFCGLARELGTTMVNLNMGCPYPIVTKKGKGAAMLAHPEKTAGFFEEVFSRLQTEVSIKVRLGLNNDNELQNLMPVLNRYPFKEIIIHPRTGNNYYQGQPDLDSYGRLKTQTAHPVVYNGDIFAASDYHTLKQAFPDTRHIMAGRGLLRNPLLAANIKGIAVERPEETVKSFIQELAKALSRDRSGGRRFPQGIKEHWWHLSHSFPESGTVFDTIKVINDLQTYHAAVEHIFENHEFLVG